MAAAGKPLAFQRGSKLAQVAPLSCHLERIGHTPSSPLQSLLATAVIYEPTIARRYRIDLSAALLARILLSSLDQVVNVPLGSVFCLRRCRLVTRLQEKKLHFDDDDTRRTRGSQSWRTKQSCESSDDAEITLVAPLLLRRVTRGSRRVRSHTRARAQY